MGRYISGLKEVTPKKGENRGEKRNAQALGLEDSGDAPAAVAGAAAADGQRNASPSGKPSKAGAVTPGKDHEDIEIDDDSADEEEEVAPKMVRTRMRPSASLVTQLSEV